jgi:hypothetical protein
MEDLKCKICGSRTDFFSDAKILYKYRIRYFKCTICDFVQTENPYWLEEAYSDAINYSDIGILKRNSDLINPTKNVINIFFNKDGKFIDYGAGYGILVRTMRDRGYKFFWLDKYCENLFARDFEAEETHYDLLTAYEVFEHLENPIDEVKIMLNYSDNILFTTYLLPDNKPKPGEWWYYTLDHGQHISIYSLKSMKMLAKMLNKNFYSNGKNIHLFTEKKISGIVFKIITLPYLTNLFSVFSRRKSLLDDDYSDILKKLKNN